MEGENGVNNNSYDFLTGLYSRQYLYWLYDELESDELFHIMFIDLDNFKSVNDVYGHNEGDLVLKAVAKILQNIAPNVNAIRLSGDEFLLFIKGECSREEITNIANTIIFRIQEKEGFDHITVNVSASIGILHKQSADISLNDLLLKSDRAMYYAKSQEKGCFVVYNDIEEEISSEIYMEQMQQSALNNKQFSLCYLPVISAQTSKLRSTQARLRWNMPDGTIKEQEDFLPLFEKNGFVRQIDMWMIPELFSNLKRFKEENRPLGNVSIQISKLLLLEKNFANTLKELADKYEIQPSIITIEVSEDSFTRGSKNMLNTFEQLKNKGFCVSIIGVGTEFKSLVYWDKLDFDCIMFDSKYIQKTLSTVRGRQIIITLLSMGRQLKMQVIADGITNRDDVLFLCSYGCNAISGPYYSGPLEEKEYFQYIQDKLVLKEQMVEIPFINNFISKCNNYSGTILGDGIRFAPGINDNWGSIVFPGGFFMENVIVFPGAMLSESWTICMWIKPTNVTSWTSVFYARYKEHYATYSPYVEGGNSIARISDGTVQGYHDILARALQADGSWHFVCMTYDERSGISRSYLDSVNTGVLTDVPSLPACQSVVFGGDAFQPSYEGYLSGVMIFNQAKSDEEIVELYERFKNEPGFCG